jgi:hypothetical protein
MVTFAVNAALKDMLNLLVDVTLYALDVVFTYVYWGTHP